MKAIDYGAMSSRELFSLAFDGHYHCVDGGPSYDEWRDAIETALRAAVIREAEQIHQIETALSEIALKAFDAGPQKTKDGHTEIRWPPTEKEVKP